MTSWCVVSAWQRDQTPPLTVTTISHNPFRFASTCAKTTNAHLLLSLIDGTHLAGIVGGFTAGVAKLTNILCIKVITSREHRVYAQAIIDGINHVINRVHEFPRPSVILIAMSGPTSEALDSAVCILPVNYYCSTYANMRPTGASSHCRRHPRHRPRRKSR